MLPEAKFRVIPLFTSILLSALLLISWHCETTRIYWDKIDNAVFFFLNGTLNTDNKSWKIFIAFTNSRMFDAISGLILAAVFLHFIFSDNRKYILERFSIGILMAICYLIIINIVMFLFLIWRDGPSLILQPVYLINDVVTFKFKYASEHSYPSDHAIILLVNTITLMFYAKKRYGILAIILTILFGLPRLIAGAHWLTDQIVGSLSFTLIGMSIVLFTPLHYHAIKLIYRIAEKSYNYCIRTLQKIRKA